MRLLLAVDLVETTEMLMNAVTSHPWPHGTKARVLSVVEDDAIPAKAWREAGYILHAVINGACQMLAVGADTGLWHAWLFPSLAVLNLLD